jgi:hypothetical protein
MSTGPSDSEIISLVLKGDHNAYALLVERYKSYVFTLTLRFTKNREDAKKFRKTYLLRLIALWQILKAPQNSVHGFIQLSIQRASPF